jgi:hypothetical protein
VRQSIAKVTPWCIGFSRFMSGGEREGFLRETSLGVMQMDVRCGTGFASRVSRVDSSRVVSMVRTITEYLF